ncbi:MAG TPA: ABC transporter ATP-binding protein [Eubacteriaceae bacterium]|jgi:putative hydroxymethylpyrimidine transport system ATP-binding protein|nr:ABC transporter ATP-binding protein [Eubacteriaceae bacterium]
MVEKVYMANVNKTFQEDDKILKVLKDISITLNAGEFVSIIGPSGCGKSTIFHILTKIVKGYGGIVKIDGVSIEKQNKKIGYMPQKDLLMPWRNLLDNVCIPLEIQGIRGKDRKKRVEKLLPIFGLEGFEKSYPYQLSGGMRQRAALLRTILIDSDILLLDEPFAALDAISRSNMQEWLLDIWQKFKHSALFITHDVEEAIYLSDRIYVLSHRPAIIVDEIKIDFPRPRIKEMTLTSEFIGYKKRLIELLR